MTTAAAQHIVAPDTELDASLLWILITAETRCRDRHAAVVLQLLFV